jgi:hypothetical protein
MTGDNDWEAPASLAVVSRTAQSLPPTVLPYARSWNNGVRGFPVAFLVLRLESRPEAPVVLGQVPASKSPELLV